MSSTSSRQRRQQQQLQNGAKPSVGFKTGLGSWLRRLVDDPVALFTLFAAIAAAVAAVAAVGATRESSETARLDDAPALYFACSQKPMPRADTFYPVADVFDYPGTYYQTKAPTLRCTLTNISKRPLVNIRLGLLALFYDPPTTSAPTTVAERFQRLIFPDVGGRGPTTNRIQTISLAPNANITFALPNVSYHTLFLDPAEQAQAQYPGDDKIWCADVYLAPGTLRVLKQGPMPKVPKGLATEAPGAIPASQPGKCIDFDALVAATPLPQPWIPSVSAKETLRKKGQFVELELPHE